MLSTKVLTKSYTGAVCIFALKLYSSGSWPFLPFNSVMIQTNKIHNPLSL